MRTNLITRLDALEHRFGAIGLRALKHTDEGRLAIRLGLGGSIEAYLEIANKAFDQATVCRDAITAMAVRNAWPLIFLNGVKRAEKFALLCENTLNDADGGAAAGRAAFEKQFGDQNAQD